MISDTLKDDIVKYHNVYRSYQASAFFSQICLDKPIAARMAKMVWDDELAELAALNVKQCKLRRDKCRNTSERSI